MTLHPAFEDGFEQGEKSEQQRIVKLLGDFWCGEPACTKHPVRMDWVIAAIQGENK